MHPFQKVIRLIKSIIGISVIVIATATTAYQPLKIADNLVAFSSTQGQKLLSRSHHKASFWKLMPFFTTERGLSWCAIASDVMALNALAISPPLTPKHAPYRLFSQANFFNNSEVLKVTIPAVVYARGVTLAQNAQLLAAYHIKAIVHFAQNGSESHFRHQAIQAVSSDNRIIEVNFCRQYIGEKGCGHFSPLAAYDKASDRFLLLDVARYKYPPVWVKTHDLFKAMSQGKDTQSQQSRGYLILEKTGE